jgi:hypothetical protein
MVQYARPDADDTDGNWTDKSGGAVLYTSIDEASADDATTYIKVADNGSDEACIVRLGDVSAPGSSGTYIKYKAMTQDNSGMGAPSLKMELLQGTTVKATTTNTGVSTGAFTAYSYTISDVSGISDWTDLKMRITMVTQWIGMSDEMHVTQAYIETQDAGGASVPIAAIAINTYKQLGNN